MSQPPSIGIDFGTTNSVVSILQPGRAPGRTMVRQHAPVLEVFRTVLCFWDERGALQHAAGPRALEAYLADPEDTRLIMSMKTYLAQRSFSSTRVRSRVFTLEALVALFLRGLMAEHGGLEGASITAGRPVRFAGELADDALGEARLREAFRQAGLGEIEVAYEPEAAGFRFTRALTAPATVLIGDFGGGALYLALGIAAALYERERSGRGQVVDSAIYEAVLAMMESLVPEWQVAGYQRERTGSVLPNVAPSNVYPTADGEAILVAANHDSYWDPVAAGVAAEVTAVVTADRARRPRSG